MTRREIATAMPPPRSRIIVSRYVVDRRPALRMEAHRRTSAQEVSRPSSPERHARKGRPQATLPSRLKPPE
jgi:hypothetical protein